MFYIYIYIFTTLLIYFCMCCTIHLFSHITFFFLLIWFHHSSHTIHFHFLSFFTYDSIFWFIWFFMQDLCDLIPFFTCDPFTVACDSLLDIFFTWFFSHSVILYPGFVNFFNVRPYTVHSYLLYVGFILFYMRLFTHNSFIFTCDSFQGSFIIPCDSLNDSFRFTNGLFTHDLFAPVILYRKCENVWFLYFHTLFFLCVQHVVRVHL